MVQAPSEWIDLFKQETVMGTELDAASAVQADINRTIMIAADCLNRAGRNTITAADALFLAHDHPASGPLAEGPGRTSGSAGGRITTQADLS